MKRRFLKAVRSEMERTKSIRPEILTEKDLEHLPEIVRKFIKYAGFVGKNKIINFRSECKGGIRFTPHEDFMALSSVQYNFPDLPSRFFYIKAKKKGIPAIGLHLYHNSKATFQVKLFGLFTVVNAHGDKMDQAETVTVLNDMFFMAPGSLIDRRIHWEDLDGRTVRAMFSNDKLKISAEVFFDDEGKLVNFISNDRFDTDGKEYVSHPWETPVSGYKDFNGYRLPSVARTIYKRPEGDFCYGEFELVNIEYNCRSIR